MRATVAVVALVLLTPGLVLSPAGAATASASIGVSATVQVSCQASAAMAFRIYPGAMTSGTPPVSVDCSNTTPYNVTLSAAVASSATPALREMTGSGAALLGYLLSSNPQRIVNWGQGGSTGTLAGPGSGSTRVLANHDQISADHGAADGTYANTIIVTVTY